MLIAYTLSAEKRVGRDLLIEEYLSVMAGGDISAMKDLYELIRTDVYAFALSKTAKRDVAEDITHDTFVQVYKNAPLYKPQGKPLAWIFTVEMNLIKRYYAVSSRSVSLDEAIKPDAVGEDFSQDVVNSRFLEEVMRVLDEEERTIITLHVNSGLKHRELAKLLNRPLSTVLSKYARAIKKLKVKIKEGD